MAKLIKLVPNSITLIGITLFSAKYQVGIRGHLNLVKHNNKLIGCKVESKKDLTLYGQNTIFL
jgi:hypothetical protein